MRIKLSVLIAIIIGTPALTYAQIPDHKIREADAVWAKRVWRQIDLRQKINQPIYYPLEPSQGYMSLYDVLCKAIRLEAITAYDVGPLGQLDDFSVALRPSEVRTITHWVDTTLTPELDTGDMIEVLSPDSIQSDAITRYQIKEDWVFDKQQSRMEVRILGIAPMRERFAEDGSSLGYTTLFWIYFPEARPILAQEPLFIRHNDNMDLSYDDVFIKRFFHAHVTKVSNVYDRNVSSYTSGIDAVIESEALEAEMQTWEADLWSY